MSIEQKSCIVKINKPLTLHIFIGKPKQVTKYFIVYKTTNLINNKIYVGAHVQKNTLEFDGYFGSGMILHHAIKKYGVENFKRETLEVCKSWKETLEREMFWIKELKSFKDKYPEIGMNGNVGGFNSTLKDRKFKQPFSEETIRRKREAMLGKMAGEKHPFYGKQRSEETKEKIRLAHLGKEITEEWRKNISEGNKGKKFSEEAKQKISKAHLGKKFSEESKRKMGESKKGNTYWLGKKHKQETIDKVSGENCKNGKYNYILSNGENYWTFFTKLDRRNILAKFNRDKINRRIVIEYNNIIIERKPKTNFKNGDKNG